MVFELVDALREQISNMNDLILTKLADLDKKHSLEESLKSFVTDKDEPLSYTPVT